MSDTSSLCRRTICRNSRELMEQARTEGFELVGVDGLLTGVDEDNSGDGTGGRTE